LVEFQLGIFLEALLHKVLCLMSTIKKIRCPWIYVEWDPKALKFDARQCM